MSALRLHEADQSFFRAQDRLHSTRGTKLDHGVLAVFSGTFLMHTTGVLTVLVCHSNVRIDA